MLGLINGEFKVINKNVKEFERKGDSMYEKMRNFSRDMKIIKRIRNEKYYIRNE